MAYSIYITRVHKYTLDSIAKVRVEGTVIGDRAEIDAISIIYVDFSDCIKTSNKIPDGNTNRWERDPDRDTVITFTCDCDLENDEQPLKPECDCYNVVVLTVSLADINNMSIYHSNFNELLSCGSSPDIVTDDDDPGDPDDGDPDDDDPDDDDPDDGDPDDGDASQPECGGLAWAAVIILALGITVLGIYGCIEIYYLLIISIICFILYGILLGLTYLLNELGICRTTHCEIAEIHAIVLGILTFIALILLWFFPCINSKGAITILGVFDSAWGAAYIACLLRRNR